MKAIDERDLTLKWLFGTFVLLYGAWILTRIEWVLGTTNLSYWISMSLAFLLILSFGLAIIKVAEEVSKHS